MWNQRYAGVFLQSVAFVHLPPAPPPGGNVRSPFMPLHRMLQLLGACLLVATVALVGRMALTEWQAVRNASQALRHLEPLRAGLVAAEMVSRERGPTNAALGDALPMAQARREALDQARARTDAAFGALHTAVAAAQARRADVPSGLALQVRAAQEALGRARARVDTVLALPPTQRSAEGIREVVYGMVAVVPLLAPVTSALAAGAQTAFPAVGDDVQGARLAAELREYAGLLGSHFTAALVKGEPFSAHERRRIDETRGRIAQLRALAELRMQRRASDAPADRAWQVVEDRYFGAARALLDTVMAEGDGAGRYGMTAADFAAQYVPEMNPILELRDALLVQARERATQEYDRAARVLALALAGSGALLSLLGAALYVIQHRVLRPLVAATRALNALAGEQLPHGAAATPARDEVDAVIGAVRLLEHQTRLRQQLERERDQLIDQLREQSTTDYLTGLPNRRAFMARAHDMLSQAERYRFGMAAVVLDVDRFKQLNDTHGHATGDRALREVANVIRAELRESDVAARFGGEEFVVLLSHCDLAQATQFAQRLREAIAQAQVPAESGPPLRVTASLGVAAAAPAGLDLDALLSAADAAMYEAKSSGRDRVIAFDIA